MRRPYRRVGALMLRVTVFERGRLLRADIGAGEAARDEGTPWRRRLPARLYDRLLQSELARGRRSKQPVFEWRRDHCLVGSWVGVIQIPGLLLEILPKIDEPDTEAAQTVSDVRNNLLEMLIRGGLGAVRSRGMANLAVKRGTLFDQLVAAFLDRTLHELRRGLDRGYLSEEGNLLALRGKLVLSRHVVHNAVRKHRFYCRHDVLSEATAITITLKQACRVLAARALPSPLMVQCQQVLAVLDEVPDVALPLRAPRPVFDRQNERFEDIHAFACMVLDGHTPDARAGEVRTFSLLFNMEKVFERYIARLCETHVMPRVPEARFSPQGRGRTRALFRGAVHSGLLELTPDLLFTRDAAAGGGTLVVDTKWKRLDSGKAARPANADLYQLYAYLRRFGCERAFLLYPQVEGVAPRDLTALGAGDDAVGTVGVRFVELDRRLWTPAGREALVSELEALVREGLALPDRESAAGERRPDASVA
ncbi:MAG: hypothetical protein R3F65_28010 [bacterium]